MACTHWQMRPCCVPGRGLSWKRTILSWLDHVDLENGMDAWETSFERRTRSFLSSGDVYENRGDALP